MPSLRHLLHFRYLNLLVIAVLIGWFIFSSTALLTHFVGDTASPLAGERAGEKQSGREEERRAEREIRRNNEDYLLQVLLFGERVVEFRLAIGGPVERYCVPTYNFLEKLRKHQSVWNPVEDSEHTRMLEEMVDACERILDLCGLCPPIVQLHQIRPEPEEELQNQPRMDSDQSSQPEEEAQAQSMSIHYKMVFMTICIFGPYYASIFNLLANLPQRIYLVLKYLVWCMVTVFIQSVIDRIVKISVAVVRFLKIRVFKIEYSADEIAMEFDQLLQQMKATQRIVENRLVAGASRNQLRVYEEDAESILERIRKVKSTYDLSFLLKVACRIYFPDFILQGEEIINVCERILVLCRRGMQGMCRCCEIRLQVQSRRRSEIDC